MSTAFRLARIAAGLLVLGLLVYFGHLDLKVLRSALGRPDLLVLAAGLLLATMPLAAFRWWLLTSGLDFPMSLAWSLRTTFISQFSNLFLPGAYGGDMVRVMLAYRAAGRGISRLTFTVLLDRLSGLMALVLLGICVLPGLPQRFHDPLYFLPWVAGSAAVVAGFVVGALWGDRIAGLFSRIPAPVGPRLAHIVREVVAALRSYGGRFRILVWVLALSVAQFMMIFAALGTLGAAMSFDALTPAGYIVAGVWSTIVNSLPLTPGGLGLGEAAFAQIAVMLETAPSGASYANAFLAMRVLTVLISLLGLLPYLAQRGSLTSATPADANAASETPPAR